LGLIIQEGSGEVAIEELLSSGDTMYICLYFTNEIRKILAKNEFEILSFLIKKNKNQRRVS